MRVHGMPINEAQRYLSLLPSHALM